MTCASCLSRTPQAFCYLPSNAPQAFDKLRHAAVVPRGTRLFVEGCAPDKVFLLCDGRVKLTIRSCAGLDVMQRMALPGEMLGLTAALSERPYDVSAEVVEASQIAELQT